MGQAKNVQLMITVDCGMTAVDEVAYAAQQGVDTIITDHHQPGDELPEMAKAIINPIRPGIPIRLNLYPEWELHLSW